MLHAQQPRSGLSQRGALVLGITVGMFMLGVARADGVLASVCLLVLLAMPVLQWKGRRNLLGLSLHVQGSHRALTGQKLPMQINLSRCSGMSSSHDVSILIRARAGSETNGSFPSIHPDAMACAQTFMEMKQRGEISSFLYRIHSSYPLGFWEHHLEGKLDHALIVAPRPVVSKKLVMSGWWREGMAAWGASHTAQAGEIRGLRAWRPGDSFKRVHAAASARAHARGQGLMVAETDPPGFAPRHATVMFHSYAADRAIIRPEMFERALSYLSGTLRYLWQQSLPATLVADFDGWLEQSCCSRRELQELSDHFSRIQRRADTELHELQRVQSQLDPQTSLIVISDMPMIHWQSAMIRREIPTIILPVHSVASRRNSPSMKR